MSSCECLGIALQLLHLLSQVDLEWETYLYMEGQSRDCIVQHVVPGGASAWRCGVTWSSGSGHLLVPPDCDKALLVCCEAQLTHKSAQQLTNSTIGKSIEPFQRVDGSYDNVICSFVGVVMGMGFEGWHPCEGPPISRILVHSRLLRS